MQVKVSTEFRAPVRFTDTTGTNVSGKGYSDVTVYIQKQAGSAINKVVSSADWFEISSANMPGIYDLKLSTSDTDTIGFLKYYVSSTHVMPYVGLLEIVANIESDTYKKVDAISNGSTDLSGIVRILGTPVRTIADDIIQIGKISQDIQKKVT